MRQNAAKRSPRIAIVGAGFSGIGAAIRLRQKGFRDVTIFESASQVGGVWAKNRYPGAACDIPSHLYSFSFAPKPNWTHRYARQPEIHAYLQDCVRRFNLSDLIRLNTEVQSAKFDLQKHTWKLSFADQSQDFDILISAVGQLNRPRIPEIEGLDSFNGPVIHTAQWPENLNLSGKSVAVIGTGASAIQAIPQIAKSASKLTVFQRSPTWVKPFWDYQYSAFTKAIFRLLPGPRLLHRWLTYAISEARIIAFYQGSEASRYIARQLRKHIRSHAPEPLQAALTPDFAVGCKRIPLSNHYYDTFQLPNVELVTAPVDRISSEDIHAGEEQFACDAVILATGFRATEFITPMQLVGSTGQSLEEAWGQSGTAAYLGMLYPNFPNFFMLYGPNTNLGHNSIIFMIECQLRFLLKSIRQIWQKQGRCIEVSPTAYEGFQEETQHRMQPFVWNGDCSSWYKDAAGNIVNNWFGTSVEYWRRTRRLSREAFRP
ncbi:MAG: NAD(P)/FAD-dependent oxidoreductase [Planctomycetota bacterium]|nr:NAD(P)/FAD-dependent oxidoreductase [Planctomycetota bacterium]